MANFASTFGGEILEVKVDLNENQSETDLLKMEREIGLEDDRGNSDIPAVQ